MNADEKKLFEDIGVTWWWAQHHQVMPKPIKEIGIEEFTRLMFCSPYGTQGIHFGQFFIPKNIQDDPYSLKYPESVLCGVHFYRFPSYAVAVVDRYTSASSRIWPDAVWIPSVEGDTYSGYEMRYFRIGCEHSFKELSGQECKDKGILHFGMCWHVKECQHCGYIQSYDSSG